LELQEAKKTDADLLLKATPNSTLIYCRIYTLCCDYDKLTNLPVLIDFFKSLTNTKTYRSRRSDKLRKIQGFPTVVRSKVQVTLKVGLIP